GHDAGLDGAVDGDAGVCGTCKGTTPFCDPTGTCVQCLENSHCDDGSHCTVDRCSFGTCTSTPQTGCVAEVTMSSGHTCARYATGGVACWGTNTFGALGDGTTTWSNVPVRAQGISDAAELAVGIGYSCARRTS